MKVHEIKKNVNNGDISTTYLHSHFININKYSQYLYYIVTFGLPEGENVRVTRELITVQREQYKGTVHLFIGTGRNPNKITFMSLITNYNHNVDY